MANIIASKHLFNQINLNSLKCWNFIPRNMETFSEFMEFNKAFNDFIKLNNPKTNRN